METGLNALKKGDLLTQLTAPDISNVFLILSKQPIKPVLLVALTQETKLARLNQDARRIEILERLSMTLQ